MQDLEVEGMMLDALKQAIQAGPNGVTLTAADLQDEGEEAEEEDEQDLEEGEDDDEEEEEEEEDEETGAVKGKAGWAKEAAAKRAQPTTQRLGAGHSKRMKR